MPGRRLTPLQLSLLLLCKARPLRETSTILHLHLTRARHQQPLRPATTPASRPTPLLAAAL